MRRLSSFMASTPSSTQDLTTGSVAGHLVRTTSFMLVTMVFQTLYFLVDLYWVGRLGKEAVAGVAVAGNVTFIVLAITQMLGVGTTTLIAHAVGRRDEHRALLVFNQSQLLSMGVSVTFLVAALLLRPWYVNALAADAGTAAFASDYLGWFIPAMTLQFGIVAMASALRGSGNFRPGMIVQSATVILNMLLAPVLIFGWGTGRPLGVAGAALSTLIAVVVGILWLATYFLSPSGSLRFTFREWKPRLDLWAQLLKIGLPAGAEFGLMAVYLFVVYTVSRPFGASAQAGFGIALRIVQAGFLPVVALGFAVAPVAGQNFGAGQASRVRGTFRVAALMAALAMVLFSVGCYLAAETMIRLFADDVQAVRVGEEYLRIVCWSFVASGVIFVTSSMFQSLGNTVPPLLTSLVRIVVVAIPALLLSHVAGFELRWIWYLSVASITAQMLMNLLLLEREFRVRLEPRRADLISV